MNRPRFRELFREKELWLLEALSTIFFAGPLLLGRTLFFRDLYLWIFPQRLRLVELVLSEGLPLWDPYINGGQPFVGEISNTALYPSAVLGFVMPPIAAVNLEIVIHFLLCGLAMYLLARIVGLSGLAALIAGLVFTFCGYTLSLGNLRILAMPHFPLLILFWHLHSLEHRQRWFLASVACGTLQLLAGSPEILVLSFFAAVAWSFTLVDPRPFAPLRKILAAALLALSVAGAAAVVLLPSAELVRRSARRHQRDIASSTTWSIDPRRLPELVVPGFFGRTDTLDEADYWGNRVEDRGFPYILSIHFGVLAMGLALSGAIGRATSILSGRIRVLLAGFTALSLVFSLGRHFPLFQLLYTVFPVAQLFRYPVKFLAGAALGIALLAGAGAQSDLERSDGTSARHRRASIGFGAAALVLLAISILLRAMPFFAERFEAYFFATPRFDGSVAHRLSLRFGFAAGFAAVGVALYWRRMSGRPIRPVVAIAAAVALELLPWGRLVNPTAPRALMTDAIPLARTLRPLLSGGRLFRDDDPASVSLRAPTNEIQWLMFLRRQTLHSHIAAWSDIPVIFHDDFDGLTPLRLTRLREFLLASSWDRRMPFLSASSVSLVLTSEQPSNPQLEPLGVGVRIGNQSVRAFRNRGAAPLVGFVSLWHFAATNAASIAMMMRPGFDPRREVIVEGSGPDPTPCPESPASLELLESHTTWSRMRLDTRCEGFLVFSQPYNPDWRLYSGDVRVPVVRANSISSAAHIRPGRRELTWVYVPVSLYLGAGLSFLTILLVAGGAAWRRRRIPVA